jgi:uridine kinase
LLEGVFLLRPELIGFHDLTVLLDIPSSAVIGRAQKRDVPRLGGDVLRKYNKKYLEAQRRHFAEVDPWTVADIIIDNSDWEHPRVVKRLGLEAKQARPHAQRPSQ